MSLASLADKTIEAFQRRLDAHEETIRRGGFLRIEARSALGRNDLDHFVNSERVAVWLRGELKKSKEIPLSRNETLSPAVIADIAMTMVEQQRRLGQNLICLLQELLSVDRHRAALSASPSEEFKRAAQIDAEALLNNDTIGVRALAKRVSVSPTTISEWRNSPEFQLKVRWATRFLKTMKYDPTRAALLRRRIEEVKEQTIRSKFGSEGDALQVTLREFIQGEETAIDPEEFIYEANRTLCKLSSLADLEPTWSKFERRIEELLAPDQDRLRDVYEDHKDRLTQYHADHPSALASVPLRLLQHLYSVQDQLVATPRQAWPREAWHAVRIEVECRLRGTVVGVRELAETISITSATITGWRESKDYQQMVEHVITLINECQKLRPPFQSKFLAVLPDHPAKSIALEIVSLKQIAADGDATRRA